MRRFNKDERKAIICKIKSVANEIVSTKREELKKNYKPSKKYKTLEKLLKDRNDICEQILKLTDNVGYYSCQKVDIQHVLENIQDSEINEQLPKYIIEEEMLNAKIILADRDESIDKLISDLLELCKK